MNGSPEEREEVALRRRFASYAAEVTAPEALYERVRSRRRRHRQRTITAMAAAALAVAAAVTVPTVGLRSVPASSTHRTAEQQATSATGVRGSLGGDTELLKSATTAAADGLWDRYGTSGGGGSYVLGGKRFPFRVNRASVRPYYAERAGDYEVVAFMGSDDIGRLLFQIETVRKRGDRWTAIGARVPRVPTNEYWDDRLTPQQAQERYIGPYVVQQVEGEPLPRPLVIVLGPRDATAEISYETVVTSEPKLQHQYQPLKLTAGTALVRARGGRLGTWVRISGDHPRVAQSDEARMPPLDRPLPGIGTRFRGSVTKPDAVQQAIITMKWELERSGLTPPRLPEAIWGGRDAAGNEIVVCAVQFPSGSQAAWVNLRTARGGGTLPAAVLAPSGSFEDRVFTFAMNDTAYGSRYVIVGPPNAVRAEIDLPGGGATRVPLDEGGGILNLPASTRASDTAMVRVFDRAGALLDERRVQEDSVSMAE